MKVNGVTVNPAEWIAVLAPLVEALGVALGVIERKRGQVTEPGPEPEGETPA